MNRGNLLSITRRFLEANNLVDGVCEARILEGQRRNLQFAEIKHQRLIVFTGVNDPDEIVNFCNERNLAIEVHPFDSLDHYESNQMFTTVDVNLTYNWRGRVLRFGQDFDLNTPQEEFDRIFLRSYWRFILTKRENFFYGTHDITPLFYHPGSSTAGFEDPMPSIKSFLKYIYVDYERDEPRRFDPIYDHVVLFGKTHGEAGFRKFRYPADAGGRLRYKTEWTHMEFCGLIDRVGSEQLAEAIRASLIDEPGE